VLERLTRGPSGPEPEVTIAQPVETVDRELLNRLTAVGEPPAKPAGAAAAAPEPEKPTESAELGKADEKLSALLRKPKP
jgi:hypothetical protein